METVTRAKEKAGSMGLNGKGTNRVGPSRFFSTTIPQLHGHRAQRSHNSIGTALKKGATHGDEAANGTRGSNFKGSNGNFPKQTDDLQR